MYRLQITINNKKVGKIGVLPVKRTVKNYKVPYRQLFNAAGGILMPPNSSVFGFY